MPLFRNTGYQFLVDPPSDLVAHTPENRELLFVRTLRSGGIVKADLLNDRVLPFFEEHEIPLLRVLTDRGTEYCGQREHHEYELYLAVENIDHSRTKARHPQTDGICERFHRTIQEEFYATAFRKKLYTRLEELQADLGCECLE